MYSSNTLTFFICGSLHISICMCIYVYVCIYVNMDLILASKLAVINCCILNFYLSNNRGDSIIKEEDEEKKN